MRLPRVALYFAYSFAFSVRTNLRKTECWHNRDPSASPQDVLWRQESLSTVHRPQTARSIVRSYDLGPHPAPTPPRTRAAPRPEGERRGAQARGRVRRHRARHASHAHSYRLRYMAHGGGGPRKYCTTMKLTTRVQMKKPHDQKKSPHGPPPPRAPARPCPCPAL